MKLSEEDISKVLVRDLPEYSEYDLILSDKGGDRRWEDLVELMARCIARGMRLEAERLDKS